MNHDPIVWRFGLYAFLIAVVLHACGLGAAIAWSGAPSAGPAMSVSHRPSSTQATPNDPNPFAGLHAAAGTAAGTIFGFAVTTFLAIVLASLAWTVLKIFLVVWLMRDARARGVEGAPLWGLVMFLFDLITLVVYLGYRPAGQLAPCSHCSQARLPTLKACPHCGHEGVAVAA